MFWPFRTASPRDEYPEPEKPLEKTETIQVSGGKIVRTKVHTCSPPGDAYMRAVRYDKLEVGDKFVCDECNKAMWWDGTTWSEDEL